MATERLSDQWHTRDLPALLSIAQLLRANPVESVHDHALFEALKDHDILEDKTQVMAAVAALNPTYIDAALTMPGNSPLPARFSIVALTDAGRRATGLWPEEDAAADALVELLNQAAETVEDADDAGRLRKAGRLLREVPGSILADVTTALIRQQAGL